MLKSVDEDEKLMQTILASGQNRQMWFLTEDGMYEVLMQSRKPIAKQFKKQVKHILKELRTKGEYKVPSNPMEALELMFEEQKNTKAEVEQIKGEVIELKENVKLDAAEYGYIGKRVQERVTETIRKFSYSNTQKVRSELLKNLNGEIKRIAKVPTRSQLKQKDFELVLDFINTWEPSSATQYQLRQHEADEVS